MKQLLVILISVFYAFGSTGVTLHFHYCGELFQYASFFNDKEKDSCCGEKGEKHGCCSSKVIKGDIDDHKQVFKDIYSFKKVIDDAPSSIPYQDFDKRIIVNRLCHYSKLHPPPIISTKVYLDNCVFLI
ncbi:MAG: hypothetical protein R2800_03185 [Flavipsychrobacter sp.]